MSVNDLRLESHGFRVGRWQFPPFCVGGGEVVTLRFSHSAWPDYELLHGWPESAQARDGLILRSPVAFAESLVNPTGWRAWLPPPSPRRWLRRNTRLAAESIEAIVAEHGMSGQTPWTAYAGNQRAILGLYRAYVQNPGIVVFHTGGLDPRGVMGMFRIVTQHLPACSAVHLSCPYVSQGQVGYSLFPGARIVPISAVEERPDIPGVSGH